MLTCWLSSQRQRMHASQCWRHSSSLHIFNFSLYCHKMPRLPALPWKFSVLFLISCPRACCHSLMCLPFWPPFQLDSCHEVSVSEGPADSVCHVLLPPLVTAFPAALLMWACLLCSQRLLSQRPRCDHSTRQFDPSSRSHTRNTGLGA